VFQIETFVSLAAMGTGFLVDVPEKFQTFSLKQPLLGGSGIHIISQFFIENGVGLELIKAKKLMDTGFRSWCSI
tara:strand:- start:492 stop:713 length:222 start_codon:yes stop_codon:yes gene_type:complete